MEANHSQTTTTTTTTTTTQQQQQQQQQQQAVLSFKRHMVSESTFAAMAKLVVKILGDMPQLLLLPDNNNNTTTTTTTTEATKTIATLAILASTKVLSNLRTASVSVNDALCSTLA